MILDRLSVLTDEVSQDLTEALDWAVRNGLRHVEIRMVSGTNVVDLSDSQVEAAAAEVRRRRLAVSAIASPLFKCALDPARPVGGGDLFGAKEEPVAAHFDKLGRAIRTARALGTDKIRIFSFWREKEPARHDDEIARHLRRAAEEARGRALLLLENETACNGGYAEEVARLVRTVGVPDALQVLWDPGNEDYGGRRAFPEGYEKVKGLFAHVHLKDCVLGADGKPRCVPIGSGRVRLREQIDALERDGYRGLYTLETRYTPEGGTAMQGTQETLDGLRRILSETASR
jgi:sugar phosphate isomerase/epimerase